MQRDPRVAGRPCLDLGVLVGVVVVHHDVQFLTGVGLGNLAEEVTELCLAVPVVALVGDLPGSDLQRGEQGSGAVAQIVMGGRVSDGLCKGRCS